MSSNDSMSMVFKCLSKGAVDFLVKPLRKNELKNLWQHVWRRCHSVSFLFLVSLFCWILILQMVLHMVFIDLEKAYDKVPRNVMWWALEKHKVLTKYITLIKDMYKDAMTFVRT